MDRTTSGAAHEAAAVRRRGADAPDADPRSGAGPGRSGGPADARAGDAFGAGPARRGRAAHRLETDRGATARHVAGARLRVGTLAGVPQVIRHAIARQA